MSKPVSPKLWFTADLHFGHENILKYTARPFQNVDAMNDELVCRWNERVSDQDSVIVLGDFAMGKRADTVPIGKLLKGHKILVPGNHDICWDAGRDGAGVTPERLANQTAKFLEWSGFKAVWQPPTSIPTWTPFGAERTILSHLPPVECGDHKAGKAVYENEIRFIEQRPPYPAEGEWMLCGHVHEAWKQHGRVINVGCDVWEYAPVSAATLRTLMSGGT